MWFARTCVLLCRAGNCGRRPNHSVPREAFRPCDNVSPGFSTPVVRAKDEDSSALSLHTMRWGLMPGFSKPDAKPDHWRMFNARSESVASNPVFRRLVERKRCVVISQGFYEWKLEHKSKQPYYVHLNDDELCFFAGLYDCWTNAAGERMHTYTILTTSSSKKLQWLHDRMPVLLRSTEACARWLREPFAAAEALLLPYNAPDLAWHAVTPALNKAGYRGEDCAKPLNRVSVATLFQNASKGAGKADAGETSVAHVKPDSAAADVAGEAVNADERPHAAGSGDAPQGPATTPSRATQQASVSPKSAGGQKRTRPDGQDSKPSPKKPAKSPRQSPASEKSGQPSMLNFFRKKEDV